MILITFEQGDRETFAAAFDDENQVDQFLSLIPGYSKEEGSFEDADYVLESIDPTKIPDYLEIEFNGNVWPISRHMFVGDERVDVNYYRVPNLSIENQGMVDGFTRVDAYVVENAEVKTYIEQREEAFMRAKSILESLGYKVARDFTGSEDGEAVLYAKADSDEFYILEYLDPQFIEIASREDDSFEAWIKHQIEI